MKEAELKKGDILLYSCKEMPHFVPKDPSQSFKKFLEANFFVLIDRLIIWSQNNSKTTHAALAYEIKTDTDGVDKCEIAEATLPYCRLRFPAYSGEDYNIKVHRLPNGLDGSPVLKELPELVDKTSENNSYAMAQASVAALVCLFRTKVADNHEKAKKLLIFLKFIAYPLGKWIDTKFPNYNGKTPFFCSQLAAYCYDMAALHLPDDRYRIKTPANSKIGDTLIDYLIKNDFNSIEVANETDLIGAEDIDLYSPEVIYSICDIIEDDSLQAFEGMLEENQPPKLYSQLKADSNNLKSLMASSKKLIVSLLKIFGIDLNNIDKEQLAKELIEFQTSFIMPADLENVFENIGEITYDTNPSGN